MKLKCLFKGKWSVCAVLGDVGERSQLEVFLQEATASYKKSAIGMIALLEYVADDGPRLLPDSLSHYVDQDEKIWQFVKGGIRVVWFYDEGQVVVCSHGFIKRTQKTPKEEKQRAIEAKRKYFAAKAANKLRIV